MRISLLLLLVLQLSSLSAGKVAAQCKSLKTLKAELSGSIRPYDFEGISAGVLSSGKSGSITISVFSKVKYRLLFNTDGFDAPVLIKVVSLNRQVLWTNEKDPEATIFDFVPTKAEKYFVEFSAPAGSGKDGKGCISVLLGSRSY
jgi:hypothetical protein